MARYFLHLHECEIRTEDEQGFECETLLAAQSIAMDAARDIMAEEVRAGRLCLSCHIAIEDSDHRWVMTVPFAEAVKINGR